MDGIHGRPRPTFSLTFRKPPLPIALLDVLGLPLLLVGVLALVTTWHPSPPLLNRAYAEPGRISPCSGPPVRRSHWSLPFAAQAAPPAATVQPRKRTGS